MTVASGMRIGAYEVTALIGEGGMGRVFRARDTRLKRDVAVKVLPDAFAADTDRLTRFHREAEALASLNHSNIASIHDVIDVGGSPVLVMELVEGETLADAIRRGPLAEDEALGIARQIADALEAAHDRGILHRDLKPANIKVTADGHVKVLDFGLAKIRNPLVGPDLSASPTIMTSGAGVILGTAAYMSPEQARGKAVDRTADVWAFGCVLYEMLAGRAVFEGETAAEVLGGVFKQEPDWSRLPADTRPAIRHLLRHCLQKDRRQRLKDIGDARLEIEEASTSPRTAGADVRQKPRRSERWAWTAAAALTVVASLAVAWAVRPAAPPPEMRVEITTPPSTDLVSMALAPDGQSLVYVAAVDGLPRLWLRPLGASARPLAETDGASFPFWSPDSRSIGFFAEGKMKRIDIGGAAPQTVATAGAGRGGTWNRDGVILFVPNAVSPIYRVSAAGGAAVALTRVKRPQQNSHRFPAFLPDGRHFLFHVNGDADARGIYIGSLDGSDPVRLCDADSGPSLGPFGRLLFVRQNALFAQQLDVDRLTLVGSPVSIATSVAFGGQNGAAAVTVSAAGSIAYRSGAAAGARQFLWFDRTGKQVGEIGRPDIESPFDPALSPDGRRLALSRTAGGNSDVWLMDVARGVLGRFTVDTAIDNYPVWSPDGSRLVFVSGRRGSLVRPVSEGVERCRRGGSAARIGREQGRHRLVTRRALRAVSPGGRQDRYQQSLGAANDG
jgi:Tol biopolymer transport system component